MLLGCLSAPCGYAFCLLLSLRLLTARCSYYSFLILRAPWNYVIRRETAKPSGAMDRGTSFPSPGPTWHPMPLHPRQLLCCWLILRSRSQSHATSAGACRKTRKQPTEFLRMRQSLLSTNGRVAHSHPQLSLTLYVHPSYHLCVHPLWPVHMCNLTYLHTSLSTWHR